MSEGPKLYANKPKKSQLKPPGSSSMGTDAAQHKPAPPPPPPPPKESFARRYKFVWPLLLAVNFSIGAYLFMRTKKKDTVTEDDVAETIPSSVAETIPSSVAETIPSSAPTTATVTAVAVPEKTISPPTITEPVKLREPIPENQQRELFKWLLEEKRKIKPKDSAEKKRIDEEKAILKEFIRAKSIPSF